jgi:hypothetical protein
MIKLTHVEPVGSRSLLLRFSDGSEGVWDATSIIARETTLTKALEDEGYFAKAFVDEGALAWPNGLDFAAHALQQELAQAGSLKSADSAASQVVTIEELRALKLGDLLTDSARKTDAHDIATILREVAKEAEQAGNEQQARAASLLQSLAMIHFTPEQRDRPYGPMIIMDGRRSAIPDDFVGSQTQVLSIFAEEISNPALQARVADIAWLNNRRDHASAQLAIHAYLQMFQFALDDDAHSRFGHDKAYEWNALNNWRRAIDIWRAVKSEGDFKSRFQGDLERALAAAETDKEDVAYCRVARLGADYRLIETAPVAENLMRRGEEIFESASHDAEQVFETAVALFAAAKNDERRRDAAIRLAELLRSMSRQSAHSPMVGAHFLERALVALHGTRNVRDLRNQIIADLRSLQVNMEEELGVISTPMDLTEIVKHVTEQMKGRTTLTALLTLASLERSPDPDEMLGQARKIAADTPLSSLFAGKSLDREGRTVAHLPAVDLTGAEDPQYQGIILRNESLRISMAVHGVLEPARWIILDEHTVTVEELLFLCSQSPCVKPGHEFTTARGLYYYLYGDAMVSASLLLPQLETVLRYLLTINGLETSTVDGEGVQERVGLPTLLGKFREPLERILSKPIFYEISNLFNLRLGPSLRHEHAHGMLADDQYYGEAVTYACWFILKLILLPLITSREELEREYVRRFPHANGRITGTPITGHNTN